MLSLALSFSLACGGLLGSDTEEETDEALTEEEAQAAEGAAPEKVQKGVHVGGENGVVVGRDGEEKGVEVGGENGVQIGKQDEVSGVRVGGEKGVMLGKDDQTTGVRIGNENGVVIDGKKGISIGGKKIIGKKEKGD